MGGLRIATDTFRRSIGRKEASTMILPLFDTFFNAQDMHGKEIPRKMGDASYEAIDGSNAA